MLFVVAVLACSGCKKAVEKVAEDFMVNLITNNLWVVDEFLEGSVNHTNDFKPYEFKFNKDGSVFGQRASMPNEVGTWQANSEAQTITSNFPVAPHPCNKLNGVWQIKKTTLSSVNAVRLEGSTEFKLFLVKK
ncbi:MAG: hypothetical protein EAY75_18215 [Bacteroidetes bacterium]|nr:MAG: hypothetical protein EAY75_18215 [Bacteroidota bacterium]